MPISLKIVPAIAAIFFIGCASTPTKKTSEERSSTEVFERICEFGRENELATGSAWIRLRTSKGGGQLPANVKARSGGALLIELLNPFGGREGVIEYGNGKLVMEGPRFKGRREVAETHWQGIPLAWASELFLYRVPCPTKGEVYGSPSWIGDSSGRKIQVDTAMGRYQYSLKSAFDETTLEQMTFVPGKDTARSLEVNFQRTVDQPLAWELKSQDGELLARWRTVDFEKTKAEGSAP